MIETQHLQELKNICTDGNEYVQIFFYHLFLSIAVGVPIITSGRLGPINRFNSAPFLCLSKISTWISNVLSMLNKLR
jgi:hypothetical protein